MSMENLFRQADMDPIKKYIPQTEAFSSLRGKIDIAESIKTLKTGSLTKIIKCALINEKMYIQLECDGEIYWIKALENPPISDNERQFMEVRYAG